MSDPLVDWQKDRLLGIITLGRRFGIFEDELLAGTGYSLAQISDSRVQQPASVEFDAIRTLQRLVKPNVPLGLFAGLDFHLRVSWQWGEALTTSQTFGEALVVAIEYFDLTFSLVQVAVSVEDGELIVRYLADHLPEDLRLFLVCRSMIASSVVARELLGHPLPLKSLTIAAPKPQYAEVLSEFAGTEIHWGSDETAVRCDIAWLQHRLPSADQAEHRRAVEECRLLLKRYRMRDGISAKVREHLTRSGTVGATSEQVARFLNVSPRTLRRHLQLEGVSFQQLLDESRMDQATQLFVLGLSVEETGRLVGYAQHSAFCHAFRRWTGTSPDTWRRSITTNHQPTITPRQ